MADRISAHRYYDGSDSCQASPRPAGLLAYLAHTSQRSASNHKGDPDIALHAISAYPMCFRLRPLLASSPSLPAESSSLSCGPPVRLQLLSTPPRSDAVTFGYRAWLTLTRTLTVLCARLHERTRSQPAGECSSEVMPVDRTYSLAGLAPTKTRYKDKNVQGVLGSVMNATLRSPACWAVARAWATRS